MAMNKKQQQHNYNHNRRMRRMKKMMVVAASKMFLHLTNVVPTFNLACFIKILSHFYSTNLDADDNDDDDDGIDEDDNDDDNDTKVNKNNNSNYNNNNNNNNDDNNNNNNNNNNNVKVPVRDLKIVQHAMTTTAMKLLFWSLYYIDITSMYPCVVVHNDNNNILSNNNNMLNFKESAFARHVQAIGSLFCKNILVTVTFINLIEKILNKNLLKDDQILREVKEKIKDINDGKIEPVNDTNEYNLHAIFNRLFASAI
ncbi:hypothetical protein HELRODRAFT_179593 [Helobdella robusta]|uniref:Uncharacterized protein n=1 Tax=Helobdella robusta TaxID=6412 RepID=T1FEX2_HELRO|nr:hypothetical protein HELRODRAFT_179593 [Helobdella robusta]ESN95255.1 hypothetical protein HELRODRAFT_179593 [Helobdella robusta]